MLFSYACMSILMWCTHGESPPPFPFQHHICILHFIFFFFFSAKDYIIAWLDNSYLKNSRGKKIVFKREKNENRGTWVTEDQHKKAHTMRLFVLCWICKKFFLHRIHQTFYHLIRRTQFLKVCVCAQNLSKSIQRTTCINSF